MSDGGSLFKLDVRDGVTVVVGGVVSPVVVAVPLSAGLSALGVIMVPQINRRIYTRGCVQ